MIGDPWWISSASPPSDAANAFRDHSMLLSDTAHVRPKAFSNIRIQDPNTFLCAEKRNECSGTRKFCYGKNCIVGQKAYNINVFSFSVQNSVTPIIESVRTPARITPYPTGRLFGVALSQALRARLRSHRPSGTFRNRR